MKSLLRYTSAVVLVAIAIVLLIPLYMRISTSAGIFSKSADVPHARVALVLGASVYRGKQSGVLEKRTDAAIELFRNGKVDKILVTGDNGQLNYDEVTPVRKYLVDAGIPAEDIFLDHAGFDTYSSMYRARDVFHADSMIIVTQDFHMPRALYIARHLGIDAYGFVAEGEPGITIDYIREIPASFKALFELTIHRTPQYLGDSILLTGTGTSTWY